MNSEKQRAESPAGLAWNVVFVRRMRRVRLINTGGLREKNGDLRETVGGLFFPIGGLNFPIGGLNSSVGGLRKTVLPARHAFQGGKKSARLIKRIFHKENATDW
ncbi:MAG: hypothetical protein KBS75_07785 [Bacteroidales bacterium]|nr:hypothetical protein [Candidatus Equimonas faecalis]